MATALHLRTSNHLGVTRPRAQLVPALPHGVGLGMRPSSSGISAPSSPSSTPINRIVARATSRPSGTDGGAGLGGVGGTGGIGNRPVGTGGPGGRPGGSGPNLPRGWTWDRVLLTLLGIALAVPAWKYLNRRYFVKPEPEHTLAKLEDKAAEIKQKGMVNKAVSDVKHATVEPVVDAVDAIKHTETARAISDVAHDVESATAKGTKSVLENIKGAATTVGRKLHVVADSTEKGIKKAVNATERATGVDKVTTATTPGERRVYYVAGGVLVGTGILAALYYWDRKGGDLKGKVRKLHDKASEAADKARDALQRGTAPPAGTIPPPRA